MQERRSSEGGLYGLGLIAQETQPTPSGAGREATAHGAAHADGVLLAVVVSWDEASLRRLEELCASADVLDVVAHSSDAGPIIRLLDEHPIDVVLIDLDTAPGDPAWLVSIVRAARRGARIVVWADDLSHFDDLFDAGVDAWISRHAEAGTLAAAVTGRWTQGIP